MRQAAIFDIDTPHFIRYKVCMKLIKKLAWLSITFVIAACQSFPISIPTVTPTNTPGPAPTSAPLPTSTALPTMEPVVRIDTGDQALFFGDYDLAREQYQAAINEATEDGVNPAALWRKGQTDLSNNRYGEAINALNNLNN